MVTSAGHDKENAGNVRRVGYCRGCGMRVEEISDARGQCPNCRAILTFLPDGNPQITVHGVDATEVERVSQLLFAKAPETRVGQKRFPLVSAAFFLVMFVVVFWAILTAARLLPIYLFPPVLIGGILTFSVVGAFILRQDATLSEKSFLDLMRLSFRYLPLLRRREK
jgi:hypothetical protein